MQIILHSPDTMSLNLLAKPPVQILIWEEAYIRLLLPQQWREQKKVNQGEKLNQFLRAKLPS